MKKIFLSVFLLFFGLYPLFSQMFEGSFGNEWIDYDQPYYKIMLSEDGVYRISYQALLDAGIPLAGISGQQFQLFLRGEEQAIYTSTEGTFGNADYIEFCGKKNRTELDRYLFDDPDAEILSPNYSLYTDTSAYFLTWTTTGNGQRYQTVNNELSDLPPKESHFIYEQFYDAPERKHNKFYQNSDGVAFSTYAATEGFGFGLETSQTLTIAPEFLLVAGGNSELRVRFGTGLGVHHKMIKLNGNEVYNEENIQPYEIRDLQFEVASSSVSSEVSVELTGLNSLNDKSTIGMMSLVYPRSFNFSDQPFFAFNIDGNGGKKYLEIENFAADGQSPVLYNLSTQQRILTDLSSDLVRIALPAASNNQELFLSSNGANVKMINDLQKIDFIDYSDQGVQYLIISNSRLYNDGQGNNRIQEYANYRSSVNGGSYSTLIVDIQQLYDQYSYGIHRHPLSVRNFVQNISQQWNDLQYIFIIGKGREYEKVRSPSEMQDAQSSFFVPTYGFPGADNLLLAELGRDYPTVASGRIAAVSPNDVRIYLDKVRVLEDNQRNGAQTITDRSWMKNILHLGGGGSNERDIIKSNLADLEQVIEGNAFGAEVTSVFKTSSDPVQISKSEQIFNIINEGVSMITFFGHSGVGTFDFDIDNPENYNNYGKYPLMFSLGCYSGNIHTASRGISERFVYYEDKGAIAFGATTGLGYIAPLHTVTKRLYELAGTTMYGQGMGDIFRATLRDFDNSPFVTTQTLIQQYTLQGDPAVKLNPSPGRDYTIDVETVGFDPQVVNAQQETFDMTVDIVNIGQSAEDSLSVEIIQEFPNGEQQVVVNTKILAPINRQSYTFTIVNQGKKAIGLNRFLMNIDKENNIEELPDPNAEQNNELRRSNGQLGISIFIVDDTAQPVFPPEFSIVDSPPTLKATTVDALSLEKKYLLEIDTTELFNSPIKLKEEITQEGGVLKWKPTMSFNDNTVYYWRVSPDSTIAEVGFNWVGSSFLYLNDGEEGWNQSHYYQYIQDDFSFLQIEPSTQRFEFGRENRDFRVKNKLFDNLDRPGYWINGGEQVTNYFPWFINAGLSVTIINPADLKSWKNSAAGDFNSFSGAVSRTYSYMTDTPERRQDVINLLNNEVPDGHYVILWTLQRLENSDYFPEEWAADSLSTGTNIFQVLEDQGANLVRQLATEGPLPYIFLYRKNVGPIDETLGENINSTVLIEWALTRPLTEGSMKSTPIGPAKSWGSLETSISEIFDPASDSTKVSVFGINPSLQDTTLLFENVSNTLDLGTVSAEQYPYLQLQYYAKDAANRTAPQLDHWRVYYTGFPEASVNAANFFQYYNDTIQQGEQFQFEIAIENLSQHDMDSLLVKYVLTDERNNEITHFDRLDPLKKDAVTRSFFEINTKTLSDKQRLTLEVNPNDDQRELFHFNNFAVKEFFIERDQRNPIMDVTFDGTHIMNGDIVSSTPIISISLKDENKYLALSDTSLFKIFIKYPNQELGQRIHFDNAFLEFFPASEGSLGGNNEAYVELRPTFNEDGVYELIVQSEDATGNQSGDLDYKVLFEVINRQAISKVLNYPNPFSTSTQFVYTLTGNTSPDFFKIQIMTVSGRIVREITQDEIGPLKIGTHRTDYRWDGTDEYGGRLANGVYLYRIVAKDGAGNNFEEHETGVNQFFKQEFGKMVIMR